MEKRICGNKFWKFATFIRFELKVISLKTANLNGFEDAFDLADHRFTGDNWCVEIRIEIHGFGNAIELKWIGWDPIEAKEKGLTSCSTSAKAMKTARNVSASWPLRPIFITCTSADPSDNEFIKLSWKASEEWRSSAMQGQSSYSNISIDTEKVVQNNDDFIFDFSRERFIQQIFREDGRKTILNIDQQDSTIGRSSDRRELKRKANRFVLFDALNFFFLNHWPKKTNTSSWTSCFLLFQV